MLEVKNLLVFYENALAINDLSLRVDKGQMVGVVGSNSAGKTTLMNTISGLIIDMKIKEKKRGGERMFISDQEVRVSGYIAHFKELELGLFLFNHEPCKSTLAVKAKRFIDLVRGPIFVERMTGTAECPGYCLHKTELRPCPARCECAHVRDMLDRVAHWVKPR